MFRRNPAVEFLPIDRAIGELGTLIAGLQDDSSCAGLLRWPSRANWGCQAVDHDTAALLQRLARASTVSGDSGVDAPVFDAVLARLVLDAVLQLNMDGTFVSGGAAHDAVFACGVALPPDPDVLGALARAAVEYGAVLGLNDSEQLAAHLYAFNTAPLTPAIRQRLRSAVDVEAWLGIADNATLSTRLNACWRRADDATNDWLFWVGRQLTDGAERGIATYKLYLSPCFDDVPVVLAKLVELLPVYGPPSFKIGATAQGLLRPDKLVVYFRSLAELQACARALMASLRNTRAQGVPFTAPLDADGLLSLGADPPTDAQLLHWRDADSWRGWVTDRLATYLCRSRASAQFALDRLWLDGVDVVRWMPNEGWLDGMMRRGEGQRADH